MSDNKISSQFLKSSFFGDEEKYDEYQPWRSCQVGEVMHIELQMAGGQSVFFSYMQKFIMSLNKQHSLLVLEGDEERVSIEGNGLRQLAQQLTRRRIKSIHQFDTKTHGNQTSGEDIVTKIAVEKG